MEQCQSRREAGATPIRPRAATGRSGWCLSTKMAIDPPRVRLHVGHRRQPLHDTGRVRGCLLPSDGTRLRGGYSISRAVIKPGAVQIDHIFSLVTALWITRSLELSNS